MPVSDNKLILLGKIIKTYGFNGAVVIAVDKFFSERLTEVESVFIEVDGKRVPFFVSWAKESGESSILIKFDDYDSRERVIEFTGSRVYINNDIMKTKDVPGQLILSGYTFQSAAGDLKGEIIKVLNLPMQYMLIIEGKEGEEILIPYNESWIINQDNDKKLIVMDLPDGIIDINS